MRTIHINTFESVSDNRVNPLETTWDDFRQLILDGHSQVARKDDAKLLNAVRYRRPAEMEDRPDLLVYDRLRDAVFTRRIRANILAVDMLVFDYDGGLTLDEARSRFSRFEHVGYTSFSHMANQQTHKFRIVLPLCSAIPAHCQLDDYERLATGEAWYEIGEALSEFAGPIDPASLNCNQVYYVPATTPARAKYALAWSNQGEWFDWQSLSRRPLGARTAKDGDSALLPAPGRGSQTLDPNQYLQTRNGLVRVRDVEGVIEGVKCPFHDDRNGTEFVKRPFRSSAVFLYCKKCRKTYFMEDDRDTPGDQQQVDEADPIFEWDSHTHAARRFSGFTDASNRERVLRQLKDK